MTFLKKQDWFLVFSVILLVTLGLLVLNSIADYLFPEYYLFILLSASAMFFIAIKSSVLWFKFRMISYFNQASLIFSSF